MKTKLVLISVVAAILVSACGPDVSPAAAPVTSELVWVAIPLGLAKVDATSLSGVRFTIDLAGEGAVLLKAAATSAAFELLQAGVGILTTISKSSFVLAVAGWASIGGGIHDMSEGPRQLTIDGVRLTYHQPTQTIDVEILDSELATRVASQIILETDATRTQEMAEGRTEVREAEQETLATSVNRPRVAIVAADDDANDAAQIAAHGLTVMIKLGYDPYPIICINDLQCIISGALNGGPDGQQAIAAFLDGGFVGMELPPDAPYPSKPARTVPGKKFTAGPWIAGYLRQLGYKGGVVYVSTEGWQTIKHYEGKTLGPTCSKENFFWRPQDFASEIGSHLSSLGLR